MHLVKIAIYMFHRESLAEAKKKNTGHLSSPRRSPRHARPESPENEEHPGPSKSRKTLHYE